MNDDADDAPAQSETDGEVAHPRDTAALFGHAEAERALLDDYRGGRMAHAWLIGGPPGIGKATLAYRMARFVLANARPQSAPVQAAQSLALAVDHPVARRVSARGHGDLLAIERVVNEKTGKPFSVIRVEDVRRTVAFFGSTAGEGGWRVCIVDSADELQYPHAANALLKILEEPPPRSLLLIVSHAPGRLLATIRSRCRRLNLRPLAQDELARAAAAALGRPVDARLEAAAAGAQGSVARAIALAQGTTAAARGRVMAMLDALPAIDARALHALGDTLARAGEGGETVFLDAAREWLHARLSHAGEDRRRLARVAKVWEKLERAAADADVYNLERKPMIFTIFGLLAETART
ncbi:MAG: DNA polymerase III subunit delta' [Proteobacteria bacterium]|nr:DNA polymerase III subunit delta' [Pseudomonadota bacterium]